MAAIARPTPHDHSFGQDRVRRGERRTLIVVLVTAVTMVVEIAIGIVSGSMALLADGLHMGSHAVALVIALFAYRYARQHARDGRFCFGTGKVNALAGFAGAITLAMFAVFMVWESIERMLEPVTIQYNLAIGVAVVGLIVNGASMMILGHGGAGHDHDHHHGQPPGEDHDVDRGHHPDHEHDHNLRSAYLHVLADALTSVLAIVALLAAKYFAFNWLDPAMGIVGAFLVARWSVGLMRQSGGVLLDHQADARLADRVRQTIEAPGDVRVWDLHIWSIGPGIYAAIVALSADHPKHPDRYRRRLPDRLGLVHVTIEVHPRRSPG